MQDNMSMVLYWDINCSFIFESWTTQNLFPFLIGCLLSGAVGFLSLALSKAKQYITKRFFNNHRGRSLVTQTSTVRNERELAQNKNFCEVDATSSQNEKKSLSQNIFLFFYYLIFSTVHVAMMLLIMTMNGYVIIFVLIGLTIGYFLGLANLTQSDKDSPVNCCAH